MQSLCYNRRVVIPATGCPAADRIRRGDFFNLRASASIALIEPRAVSPAWGFLLTWFSLFGHSPANFLPSAQPRLDLGARPKTPLSLGRVFERALGWRILPHGTNQWSRQLATPTQSNAAELLNVGKRSVERARELRSGAGGVLLRDSPVPIDSRVVSPAKAWTDSMMLTTKLAHPFHCRERAQNGDVYIWLDPGVVAKLKALRGPGESYSDAIIRVARGETGRRKLLLFYVYCH